MKLIKSDVNIDFLGMQRTAFFISLTLIMLGLIFMVLRGGPNYGIEFEGGTLIHVNFESPVSVGEIRDALSTIGLGDSEIKEFGSPNDVMIRTELQEGQETAYDMIKSAINARFPENPVDDDRVSIENVGPKIGAELIRSTIMAILLAIFFLVIYISWRFEFKFALGAIAALMHDIFITLGVFSIVNKEISLAIVAALLTILGYSLNDTIVVSDRIRENNKVMRRDNFHNIINRSLNQTLSRTIITSLTTLIVLVTLFIWGGEVLKDFAFALIVGVIIGTYSSIFVATPIVVKYHDWKENKKKLR